MKRILKVSIIGVLLLSLYFTNIYSRAFSDTAQNNHLNDHQEEIIFEYDTVVLPSDTIRITDTITIVEDSIKRVKKKQAGKSNKYRFSIPSRFIKHSFYFQFSPFLSNQYFDNPELIDSIRYPGSQPINYYYDLEYGIQLYKWLIKAGINFINFSEKSQKRDIFIKDTVTQTSIKTVKETVNIRNYFYYAGLQLNVSYNIRIGKFNFYPEVDFILSKYFPVKNYKFGSGTNTSVIPDNKIFTYMTLMGMSLPFEYEIYKDISLYLKPSLLGNLSYENKYPHTLKYAYLLGFGVKFTF